jgi:hypothetical protein
MSKRFSSIAILVLPLAFGCSANAESSEAAGGESSEAASSEPSGTAGGDDDESSSALPSADRSPSAEGEGNDEPPSEPSSNDPNDAVDSPQAPEASNPIAASDVDAPTTNTSPPIEEMTDDNPTEEASSEATQTNTDPEGAPTSTPEREPMTSPFDGPEVESLPNDSSDVVLGDAVNPGAPFCPGFDRGTLDLCESDADCAEGQQCFYENTPRTCTLGCAGPFDECGDDTQCPTTGWLCVGTPAAEISGVCVCGGGTYCVAPCTSDDDCGTDASCEVDGRCQPRACDDDTTCPASQKCDPTSAEADEHGCRFLHCSEPEHPGCGTNRICDPSALSATGCVRQACATGADCECGACSPHGSECVSRPGFCAGLTVPG